MSDNGLEQLKEHIDGFMATAELPQHHRAMAQAKAQELIFWLRAGLTRSAVASVTLAVANLEGANHG